MLRKSYSINIDHSTLMSDYYSLPTGIQLSNTIRTLCNLDRQDTIEFKK